MRSNRFALFITARLGSKRLPNKHLIDMGGILPIEILIRRLKKLNIPIVLTTGNEEINLGFKPLCEKDGIELFFGNVKNIPLRHFEAATKLNYDFVFSIDGDDVLTAPEGISAILNQIQNENFTRNFYSTKGFPFGMNSSGYSKVFLETSLTNFHGDSLETGWGRLFPEESFVTISCASSNEDKWRLSLDYEEDLAVFKNIWNHFGQSIFDVGTEKILDYFRINEVWKLNSHIIEKYWDNFYAEKNKEIQNELKR